MNFIHKAKLQKVFSSFSKGEKINYFFQRYITKSLPINDEEFVIKLNVVSNHFKNFYKYGNTKKINECSYFEFGSGYDLAIPIGISLFGFRNLICIDIRKLIFHELINNTISRLNLLKNRISFEYTLPDKIPQIDEKNYREVLLKYFSIDYKAPLDARHTKIPSNSIDFILSNATMEHIPGNDLKDILKECFRIMKPGGIMSNIIDYRDHFSFFDNSISVYNYLKYSEEEWNRINPPIMYQNRLRHRDYVSIINEIGFEIVEEKVNEAELHEVEQLKNLVLDTHYKENYSLKELSIKASTLVLRKN